MPQIMDFLFIHFSFASGFACNHLKLYAALVVEAGEANYLVNPSNFEDLLRRYLSLQEQYSIFVWHIYKSKF